MSAAPRRYDVPAVVCDEIGQGRVRQCDRRRVPGGWPAHMRGVLPEYERRCAACDDVKRHLGVLERLEAEWLARHGPLGRKVTDEERRQAAAAAAGREDPP